MHRTNGIALVLAIALAGRAYGQSDEQVAPRLTKTVHICEAAPENGGTFQQALCNKDKAARQDQRLNAVWSQVIGRLPLA